MLLGRSVTYVPGRSAGGAMTVEVLGSTSRGRRSDLIRLYCCSGFGGRRRRGPLTHVRGSVGAAAGGRPVRVLTGTFL